MLQTSPKTLHSEAFTETLQRQQNLPHKWYQKSVHGIEEFKVLPQVIKANIYIYIKYKLTKCMSSADMQNRIG